MLVGGFGLAGAPLALIEALAETSSARDLTIVSNNIGEPGRGLGKLLRQGRIRRGISSYFTSNPEAVAAVNAGEIEALIKAALPDARVTIRDLAGDGDHYAAEVVSESFRGKNRVQQHKLVYDALQGRMGGALHALQLVTAVPN